jgi:hypothetical protein
MRIGFGFFVEDRVRIRLEIPASTFTSQEPVSVPKFSESTVAVRVALPMPLMTSPLEL